LVIEKPIFEEKENWENEYSNGTVYDEVGTNIVFDKIIQIK